MTVEKIGTDFITNRMVYYKDILKKIKIVFTTRDIDIHSVSFKFEIYFYLKFLGVNFVLLKLAF